jgi:hypothetical protein
MTHESSNLMIVVVPSVVVILAAVQASGGGAGSRQGAPSRAAVRRVHAKRNSAQGHR